MPLELGTVTLNKLYLGTVEITKAYLGTVEVYGSSVSVPGLDFSVAENSQYLIFVF